MHITKTSTTIDIPMLIVMLLIIGIVIWVAGVKRKQLTTADVGRMVVFCAGMAIAFLIAGIH